MNALWYAVFFGALAWSAIAPKDYFIWFLEVLPGLVAFALLFATRARFRFTPLAYWLVLAQCLILMVGGHYTYAEVPLFDWLRDVTGGTRNNFDKVGHFAQGFVPAVVVREILARFGVVRGKAWLEFVVVMLCLAISALYEMFEWAVAAVTGEAADAFLGTQGYAWDTQSDMALALVGAGASVALLRKLHDRQIAAAVRTPH
jgi:putative membrane protein